MRIKLMISLSPLVLNKIFFIRYPICIGLSSVNRITFQAELTPRRFPQGAYQRRARPATDAGPPIGARDAAAEPRLPGTDSELPFELRGELV